MDFVDSLTEPCLALFRRFVPMFGPLDLSPLVAILDRASVGHLARATDRRLMLSGNAPLWLARPPRPPCAGPIRR